MHALEFNCKRTFFTQLFIKIILWGNVIIQINLSTQGHVTTKTIQYLMQ